MTNLFGKFREMIVNAADEVEREMDEIIRDDLPIDVYVARLVKVTKRLRLLESMMQSYTYMKLQEAECQRLALH